jgi:hypothetical protein
MGIIIRYGGQSMKQDYRRFEQAIQAESLPSNTYKAFSMMGHWTDLLSTTLQGAPLRRTILWVSAASWSSKGQSLACMDLLSWQKQIED